MARSARTGLLILMLVVAGCDHPSPRLSSPPPPRDPSDPLMLVQSTQFQVDSESSYVSVGNGPEAAHSKVRGWINAWGLPCASTCELRMSTVFTVPAVAFRGHRAEQISFFTANRSIAVRLEPSGRLTLDAEAVQGGLSVKLDGQSMGMSVTATIAPAASIDSRTHELKLAIDWELPDGTPVHAQVRALAAGFPPRAVAESRLERVPDGGTLVVLDASKSIPTDSAIERYVWRHRCPDGGSTVVGMGPVIGLPEEAAEGEYRVTAVDRKMGISEAVVRVPR